VKESKKTDSEIESRNGHMARNTVQDMVQSYFLRRGEDRTILPEDIRGEIEEEKTLDEAMEELESFVGMEEIKRTIRSLAGRLRVRLEREGPGGSGIPFHVVLTGNPGTGKTSVTRVLGEVLRALGLLETGHVVEVDRSRLVGRYVGQTAPLVNEVCDRAMGGVLFIDEAYALARGEDDGKDFGREAIETLLKRMEDDRGKFVVVAAGYTREMEAFLALHASFRASGLHAGRTVRDLQADRETPRVPPDRVRGRDEAPSAVYRDGASKDADFRERPRGAHRVRGSRTQARGSALARARGA
jgi:hypothetical protein